MEDGTDETDPTAATVLHIKFVAYSVVAYIIVGLGLVGNLLNLVVLTRPNLKAGINILLLNPPPPHGGKGVELAEIYKCVNKRRK